jgi:hypothetical protein
VPGYWKIAPNTACRVQRLGRADDHLDAQRLGPRLHHRDVLRMAGSSTKNPRALDFATRSAITIASAQAVASSSSEALATRQPRQVRHHRLEVQQRLKPPLRDLGLVGRVGGVPGRVLQHVALDRGRRVGAVIALPDHLDHGPVLRRDLPHVGQQLRLRHRRPIERARSCRIEPGTVSSISASRLVGPDRAQHLGHLGGRGADMAAVGEIGRVVVGGRPGQGVILLSGT